MKNVICRERRPRRSAKRIMSIILSFMMLLSITAGIDFSAYALSSSGSCGENVTYTFDSEAGILEISGTGAMKNYSSTSTSPFSNQSSIKEVVINTGVTNIGYDAFYNCTGLTSVTIGNGVTSIGNSAFRGCTGLKSITIPDSVTSIGYEAFYGCTGLTSVTIPDSLTSISSSAFSGCTGLTSITIPDSVTSIGSSAFYGCTGLKELTMPCSAKIYNSENTFYKCINIEKVTLTKGIGKMQSYTNTSTATATYYQYTPWYISRYHFKTLVIEDGVIDIGVYTFSGCTGLTSVTIPDSVTSIGYEAFSGCTGLTSVTIPDSVTSIGESAFSGCSSLTNIAIPDSVTSIGRYAFYGCTGLTSVTIGNGVTSIGMSAFKGCSGLTSITIGNGVTSIGNYAFEGCSGLTSITIPDSVTSIGTSAFSGCTGLKELTMPCSAKIYNSQDTFYNCTNIEKVTLTKGTGKMQNYTKTYTSTATDTYYQYTPWYTSRNKLKTLVIEDSVTSIGDYAFYNCTGLTSVTIGEGVTSIGNYAFNGSGLTSVITSPDGIIMNIGTNAFKNTGYYNDSSNWNNGFFSVGGHILEINCTFEGDILIPDGTKVIYDNVFADCTSISGVVMPDSVKYVGNHAFSGCTALSYVIYSNSLKSIGEKAFYGCNVLLKCELPDSLEEMGASAYEGCTSLKTVKTGNGLTTIPSRAFYGDSKITTVDVGNSVTSIGDSAFFNNSKLNKVVLSESVNSISDNAFGSCYALTEITIPASASITSSSFNGCANISSITVTPGTGIMKTYNATTYKYTPWYISRNSLQDVILCEGITSIGPYAFYYNTGIKEITVPSTVTKIGNMAFNGADNLTDISILNGKCNVYDTEDTLPVNTVIHSVPGDSVQQYATDYFRTFECLEHTLETQAAKEATCTETGLTEGSHCTVCGKVLSVQETIAALGHDYDNGVITTEPSCIDKGIKTFTCSRCNDTYTEEVDALGHNIVIDKAKNPTCTEYGLTEGSHCSVCGAIIVSQNTIEKIAHSYNYSVVTPATCTVDGLGQYTCSGCGDAYTEIIPAKGHSYKNVTTKQPTCTEQGLTTFTCSICGDEYTEDIEMLAHTPVTDAAVAATCTKTGLTEGSHCSVCGTVIVAQTVIPAKQHNYVPVVTAPTCRDKGYTTYTCSVCQDSYRADYTDRTNDHDYKGVVTKLPTCTSEGVKTFTCSVCNDTYTEPVEIIAHTPTTDSAVAPTGTSTGLTEGSHCSVCGEVLVAQEIVPALIPEGASVAVNGDKAVIILSDGSTITVPKDTKETVKNADGTYTVTLNDGKSVTVSSNTEITKTADGQLNVKATDNGKTTTVTVPSGSSVVKNGDNYKIIVVNGTETVEKTVAAGETVVIDKSGSMSCNGNHKWDKGVVTIAATCTSEGVKTYTCSVCGNQKIEKLKKVAHKPVADKAVPATFVSAGKTAGTHCSVCGKIIVAQKPVAMLGAAKLSKVKKGKKSFTATWKSVANVDGYEIQYSLKKNMKKAKTKSVASSKKKLKVKKLKAKKKYYVRIRAYKVINGKKQYSAWSAKKKVKTK